MSNRDFESAVITAPRFLFFFVSRGLDLHSAVPKIAVNHAT